MLKRRIKRKDELLDSEASQSEDENYDNSHEENQKKIEPAEVNVAKKSLLQKMVIFKMIHENKYADGKSSSNESKMESLNEILTLQDKNGYKTLLDEYMIRSTSIRWLTYGEDMEHWDLRNKNINI